ncbi:MAG: hypothetical protein IT370_11260 [Deltaproteobacteria bacterium]|nr:hypothetical protein [Deltaproteobacteria bacterium]
MRSSWPTGWRGVAPVASSLRACDGARRHGGAAVLLVAAALLITAVAAPAPAAAGPLVVRVHKGLPGAWPGLALVPDDAEYLAYFSAAPLELFAQRQGVAGGAGPMLSDLADATLGHDLPVGVRRAVAGATRSVMIALAASSARPGQALSGLVILGLAGGPDERKLEAALALALPLAERVGARGLYLRRKNSRESEVVAAIPGGLVFGHVGWVRAALTRFGTSSRVAPGAGPASASAAGGLVESAPAQLARQRIPASAAAFVALSPGAGTRAQLRPIKAFLGSFEGAAWMLAGPRNEPSRFGLRLGFASATQARDAAAFARQIFGLSNPLFGRASRGSLEAALLALVSAAAGALRVEGADVVADLTR